MNFFTVESTPCLLVAGQMRVIGFGPGHPPRDGRALLDEIFPPVRAFFNADSATRSARRYRVAPVAGRCEGSLSLWCWCRLLAVRGAVISKPSSTRYHELTVVRSRVY